MRLWSKQLIDALPNKQLKGQWRECCAIAKGINEQKPLPLLVNRIADYPLSHFVAYTKLVDAEMNKRGIGHRVEAFTQYFDESDLREKVSFDEIFSRWHDFDYMFICSENLREKFMCGGLTADEWCTVIDKAATEARKEG